MIFPRPSASENITHLGYNKSWYSILKGAIIIKYNYVHTYIYTHLHTHTYIRTYHGEECGVVGDVCDDPVHYGDQAGVVILKHSVWNHVLDDIIQ